MSEPMDLAFRLLKRQTELGEHPGFEDEAFSSHGPVTHYHATKLPENAESISRHGIWPMGNYATHSGGKTKAVYSDLVDNMKLENKEPLIWATGEGQKLPIEYAGTYDDKWVGEPQFDESGMLIPGTGPSHEKEFQEGGMFGIRGSDIDWERSPSPIYRQGEEFYIHNQPIPREQIIPMPVQTGEPMDIAFRLLKDRKSPEAFANKKKYDTKYHDNPKRREYRAELARERRKRNVMGNGGKDMSHAKNGKIVSEDASKNRARHFKSRGTLK